MLWVSRRQSGPQRVNHAAAVVGDQIYSFGGYCSIDVARYMHKIPMDIQVLNTHTLEWVEVELPGDPELYSTPFLRYGHSAVTHDRMIYIWGGRNDHNACNRLFCFNTEMMRWSTPSTTGDTPCPRDGHSACVINNIMYIIGGFEEEFERFSRDVYAIDLETMNWSYFMTRGQKPPYTDFQTATAIGNRIYVFGGRSDRAAPSTSDIDFYPNEIVYLDTEAHVWVKPPVFGDIPVGRRSHSAFVYNEKLYIFGGYNSTLKQHFNDIHCYDPITSTWTRVQTFGIRPTKRRRQVCLTVKNKMYLFGGTSPSEGYHPTLSEIFLREQDLRLIDHGDLHVLDMNPSLKTLAMMCVIRHRLIDPRLPYEIRNEIKKLEDDVLMPNDQ